MTTLSHTAAVATLGILSMLTAGTASANHDATHYFALEYSSVSIGTTGPANVEDVNPTGLRLRLGTDISKNLDIEAQFGAGDDVDVTDLDAVAAIYGGVYLKTYLPVGSRSALFALGGWGFSTIVDVIDTEDEDSDVLFERSGLSYGLGFESELSNNLDLTADYMVYSQGEPGVYDEVSAVNVGLKLYF